MRRSVIDKLREASLLILAVGFVLYVQVCWPVVARRGYPEMDPFFLAIPWLWPVPVIASAPWDSFSKARAWSLLGYALATAVIMGGCFNLAPVPRSVDLPMMLSFGLVIWGPIHIAATAVTEAASRFALRHIRVFVGFPPAPAIPPGVVKSPLRLRAFYVAVLLVALAFPFAYRQRSLALARQAGRQWAERDWEQGEARMMVPFSEMDNRRGVWVGHYDPGTGLEIGSMPAGIVLETEYEAYRQVIEEKLARHGRASLADCLFTEDELVSLLSKTTFERVASFLFRYGGAVISGGGSSTKAPNGTYGFEMPRFMYRTVVPEKGNVMVLVTDRGFAVIHPDGRVLQFFRRPVAEGTLKAGD